MASAPWSDSNGKRIFDVVVAALLLLLLTPVILVSALAVKLSSPGPAFFRQIRVGRRGRNFLMWKLRTMRAHCQHGPCVTKTGDARLTAIGIVLRRLKFDEMPQLINVIKGDMSMVGPRPKVPHHETQGVDYRPGITGAASIAFRDEEALLHRLPEHCLDEYQVKILMPMKRRLDREYMKTATLMSDCALLVRTVLRLGEMIQESDLLQFQKSLVSLDSALRVEVAAGRGFVQADRR